MQLSRLSVLAFFEMTSDFIAAYEQLLHEH